LGAASIVFAVVEAWSLVIPWGGVFFGDGFEALDPTI